MNQLQRAWHCGPVTQVLGANGHFKVSVPAGTGPSGQFFSPFAQQSYKSHIYFIHKKDSPASASSAFIRDNFTLGI